MSVAVDDLPVETEKYAGARKETYTVPSVTQLPKANSTRLDEFGAWLDERREKAKPYPLQHTWSHRSARKRFARAKDVERFFWDSGEKFTTVLLTRTADKATAELLEQTESLHPRAYKAKRRRLLKGLDDGYAGVSCIAPKYQLPMPNSTVLSHVHEAYWIKGHHSPEAFEPLIEKHNEKVPGATGGHISVQHFSPETEPRPEPQSEDDEIGGTTSALPYELAENLPLMNVETDAADLHDTRALEWCATLSADSDGDHSTGGVHRWQPFGEFKDYADTVREELWFKAKRDYRRTMPWLSPHAESNAMQSLDQPQPMTPRLERQFIDDYCDEIGNPTPSVIRENLDQNRHMFDGEPDRGQIVAIVRGRLART